MERSTLADGRYELLERLGAGGMATVWRVRDHKLEIDRACKLLTKTAPTIAERFEREARVMARVRHPNVVQVLDVGVDDDVPWMVMEWVPGGSLQGRLDSGEIFELGEVVRLGAEICAGLKAAHDAGVVHRDVKPANVLVTRGGEAKVADFGIARAEHAGPSLTASGMAMGTLAFMAPEQRQDARHVDERADVYAVGATLYALVTGERPLELYNPVVARQVYGPVPAALRPVLQRATRFSPGERYGSVEALAAALQAVVDGKSRPSARLSRVVLGGALGVGALAALGLLGVGASAGARLLLAPVPAMPEAPGMVDVEMPPRAQPVDPPAREEAAAPPVREPAPEPVPVAEPAPSAQPPPPTRSEGADEGEGDAPRPGGAFFVNSVPPSQVHIDHEDRGGTPLSGTLDIGSHVVELRHPQHGTKVLPLVVDLESRAEACWNFREGAPCSRR